MPRGVKYATEEERLAARRASKAAYRSKPENVAKERAGYRAWCAANPEKKRAANTAWREANPDHPRDPEAARVYSAEWYQRNKERRAATAATWRRENPERQSEYRKRRRARRLGSEPDLTLEQWLEVLEEFDYKCAYCSADGDLEQDHVWPVSRGGRHTKDNMAPACRSCNASKGSKLLAEWLAFV